MDDYEPDTETEDAEILNNVPDLRNVAKHGLRSAESWREVDQARETMGFEPVNPKVRYEDLAPLDSAAKAVRSEESWKEAEEIHAEMVANGQELPETNREKFNRLRADVNEAIESGESVVGPMYSAMDDESKRVWLAVTSKRRAREAKERHEEL
jgi:hypothetical protein